MNNYLYTFWSDIKYRIWCISFYLKLKYVLWRIGTNETELRKFEFVLDRIETKIKAFKISNEYKQNQGDENEN